jgi:acetyl esterase/lipase
MTIAFDDSDLAATRKANDGLARMPRLRLQSPIHRNLIQGLLAFGGWVGPDLAARAGVAVEERMVTALGRAAWVRILRPPGVLHGVHVHIHGGGWTIGNARMDDAMNAQLASSIHVAVVSVDYRLIPAFAFTDCIDDCEIAARWVLEAGAETFGTDRMTIGGESAGGHLAAATILRLRDAGVGFDRVKGAALTYGCYDLGGTEMRRRAGPETLVLHGPTMSRILDKARGITADNRRDPALSPLYAELSGLPPALFVVGTRDPLQEDTELMYAKWVRQSHNAQLTIVPEAAHGFNKQANSTAEKTNAFIRAWIGRQLAS